MAGRSLGLWSPSPASVSCSLQAPPVLPRSASSGWMCGGLAPRAVDIRCGASPKLISPPTPHLLCYLDSSVHHWMAPSPGSGFISTVTLEKHCVTKQIILKCPRLDFPSSTHCYLKYHLLS